MGHGREIRGMMDVLQRSNDILLYSSPASSPLSSYPKKNLAFVAFIPDLLTSEDQKIMLSGNKHSS